MFKFKPPAHRAYPPACKPYGLEAAPEGQVKISTTPMICRTIVGRQTTIGYFEEMNENMRGL